MPSILYLCYLTNEKNGRTVKIILPKEFLIASFLYHYLRWYNIPSLGYSRHYKLLKEIQIPIPPIDEQLAIVSELDSLSSIIAKHKQLAEEYDRLEQSIFHDMFGDPVTNDKSWDVKKLGEVCEITSSKRIFADEYVEYGIPFYRSKEVIERSKNLPISVELFISQEKDESVKEKYGIPQKGDVLITAVGTIGKIWTVDTNEPFYFKDGNLVWLKDINRNCVDNTYFNISLGLLIEEYKKINANGAAYNALTIVKLKEMETPFPPLSLQTLFAEKIQYIEAMKSANAKAQKEAETLFAERMNYYFGE